MDVAIREESDHDVRERRIRDFYMQDKDPVLPFRMVYRDGDAIRSFEWFNNA